MDRFGVRPALSSALVLIASGLGAQRLHDRQLAAAAGGVCWSASGRARSRWASSQRWPPARRAGHLGIHHFLRTGLGGHRPTDDRVVPRFLRIQVADRIRWDFCVTPARSGSRGCGAGWIRDLQGDYDLAFYLATGLYFVAVALCAGVRRPATPEAARSRSIWRDPPWRIRFIRRRGDAEA